MVASIPLPGTTVDLLALFPDFQVPLYRSLFPFLHEKCAIHSTRLASDLRNSVPRVGRKNTHNH